MSFVKLFTAQVNSLNRVIKSLDSNVEKCWNNFSKLYEESDLSMLDDDSMKILKKIYLESFSVFFEDTTAEKAKIEEERKLKKEKEEMEKKEKAMKKELEKKEREERKRVEEEEKEKKKKQVEEERRLKKEKEEMEKKEKEEKRLKEKQEREEKKRLEEEEKKKKEMEKLEKKKSKDVKSDGEKTEKSGSDSENEKTETYSFDKDPVDVSDEEFWKWKKANLKGESCLWNKKTNIVCKKEGEKYIFVGLLENKKLLKEEEIKDNEIKNWINCCGIVVKSFEEMEVPDIELE
jgi:hypothetical protein